MEDLSGTMQQVVETAQANADYTNEVWFVYRDAEIGDLQIAPEVELGFRLVWLNLADVLWTSRAGVLSYDLLDPEYKRLAQVRDEIVGGVA